METKLLGGSFTGSRQVDEHQLLEIVKGSSGKEWPGTGMGRIGKIWKKKGEAGTEQREETGWGDCNSDGCCEL